jgi:hypothetical protein
MKQNPREPEFGEAEAARRAEAALLRALSTPHKRQSEMKIGKPKPDSGGEANPKKRGRPVKNVAKD